jgi:hypothetical protein
MLLVRETWRRRGCDGASVDANGRRSIGSERLLWRKNGGRMMMEREERCRTCIIAVEGILGDGLTITTTAQKMRVLGRLRFV